MMEQATIVGKMITLLWHLVLVQQVQILEEIHGFSQAAQFLTLMLLLAP